MTDKLWAILFTQMFFFGDRNKKYIVSKNYIFDQKISVDPRSDIQKF